MTEHPAWPWIVFGLNTFFVCVTIVSILSLVFQQQALVREINHIDRVILKAIRVNQANVNIVAKKAGVPKRSIVQPVIPSLPEIK